MAKDGTGTGYSYSFDDENHLTIATGFTGGPYCYVYDGNGLRVAKKSNSDSTCTTGTVTKLYWRSISGDSLAETDGTGSVTNAAYNEYVFFGGRRVASRNGTGGIFYYFADQLGSTRTVTTGSGPGQTPGQLCYDADFTPYGQEISHTERLQTTACPPNYKFTGYERDSETGLDYAFARFYSSRLGRFLSIDPLGGLIGNLQSHNAYAYVMNDLMTFVDPSCLCPQWSPLVVNGRFLCTSAHGPSSRQILDEVDWFTLLLAGFDETFYYDWYTGTFYDYGPLDPQGGNGSGPADNTKCGGGKSTGTTTIVNGSYTNSTPTVALGTAIGGYLGGPPGAAIGGIIGSYFGVGVTASWVPSKNSWYVGPAVAAGIVPCGGSGFYVSAVTVRTNQNPNVITSNLSFLAS